jgi:hypothetical protein
VVQVNIYFINTKETVHRYSGWKQEERINMNSERILLCTLCQYTLLGHNDNNNNNNSNNNYNNNESHPSTTINEYKDVLFKI